MADTPSTSATVAAVNDLQIIFRVVTIVGKQVVITTNPIPDSRSTVVNINPTTNFSRKALYNVILRPTSLDRVSPHTFSRDNHHILSQAAAYGHDATLRFS